MSGPKQQRTKFNSQQIFELERLYAFNPKPLREMMIELGNKFGLELKPIQVWFQNRRMKARNQKEEPAIKISKELYSSHAMNRTPYVPSLHGNQKPGLDFGDILIAGMTNGYSVEKEIAFQKAQSQRSIATYSLSNANSKYIQPQNTYNTSEKDHLVQQNFYGTQSDEYGFPLNSSFAISAQNEFNNLECYSNPNHISYHPNEAPLINQSLHQSFPYSPQTYQSGIDTSLFGPLSPPATFFPSYPTDQQTAYTNNFNNQYQPAYPSHHSFPVQDGTFSF